MHTIVKMIFGSHLYGTSTPSSDTDYKGIFFPSQRDLYLQRVPKSISEKTKQHGNTKNTAQDVDSEMYSLVYFVHLALAGETVALDMLHAPIRYILESHPIWSSLVAQREKFYTKNLKSFVGYARRQAAKYGVKGSRLADAERALQWLKDQALDTRMEQVWSLAPLGEHLQFQESEGTRYYDVCGKKLMGRAYCQHYVPMMEQFVTAYGHRAQEARDNQGIDWKAISHAFRAAYQVRHILLRGGYTYPLPETPWIRSVKSGELDFLTQVSPALEELMEQLEGLSQASDLPAQPDRAYWDDWLFHQLIAWQGISP